MKKSLLIFACLVGLSNVAMAQFEVPTDIIKARDSKTYEGIVTNSNAAKQYALAYGSDNSLFISGVFDTAFEGLEPIAASSYIMKTGDNLTPTWKIALQGAATITAMTADADGGVFVAGGFADEVIFNSTDGKNITKEGIKNEDAFITSQNAAFVAHYDKDGKLLKVNSFIPEFNPEIPMIADFAAMIFGDDARYCKINGLVYSNGKLYANALFNNILSKANGSVAVEGGSALIWFSYNLPLGASAVLELDNDLNIADVPCSVTSGTYETLENYEKVASSKMTIKDGICYVAFIGSGNLFLNVNGSKVGDAKYTPFEGEEMGQGYGMIVVDLASKTMTANKIWEINVSSNYDATFFTNLSVADGNLYATGLFQEELAFDTNIKCAGSSDMFITSLNPSTLATNWAAATGHDEGDKTKNEEVITSSCLINGKAFLFGYTGTKSPRKISFPLTYTCDLANGTMTKISSSTPVLGATSNGTAMGVACTDYPITDITFANFDSASGVENVVGNNLNVSVYPNPATDVITLSETANVEIYSAQGALVVKADNTNTVTVSQLSNGVYFLKANINGTTTTTKFIKK